MKVSNDIINYCIHFVIPLLKASNKILKLKINFLFFLSSHI